VLHQDRCLGIQLHAELSQRVRRVAQLELRRGARSSRCDVQTKHAARRSPEVVDPSPERLARSMRSIRARLLRMSVAGMAIARHAASVRVRSFIPTLCSSSACHFTTTLCTCASDCSAAASWPVAHAAPQMHASAMRSSITSWRCRTTGVRARLQAASGAWLRVTKLQARRAPAVRCGLLPCGAHKLQQVCAWASDAAHVVLLLQLLCSALLRHPRHARLMMEPNSRRRARIEGRLPALHRTHCVSIGITFALRPGEHQPGRGAGIRSPSAAPLHARTAEHSNLNQVLGSTSGPAQEKHGQEWPDLEALLACSAKVQYTVHALALQAVARAASGHARCTRRSH
jgi:hypothetical protein